MKLIYAYIRSFRNIHNEEVVFSDDFDVAFENGKLFIKKSDHSEIKDFIFGNNHIKDLRLIIGPTGSGKTNILQLVGMDENSRHNENTDDAYFLLYHSSTKVDYFVVEMFGMTIPDIAKIVNVGRKRLAGFDCVSFRYDFLRGKVSDVEVVTSATDENTIIVNAFDRYSFTKCPYVEVVDRERDKWLDRMILPFDETFPSEIVQAAQGYLNLMPAESIKRKASFVINRQNWQFAVNIELDPQLVAKEYWQFGRRRQENRVVALSDIPYGTLDGKMVTPKIPPEFKKYSPKQRFIHDLLTDYAIYLRKIASTVNFIAENLPRLRPLHKDRKIDPTILPDGVEDLTLNERINWLCQYIDYHTDGMYGNKGLLYQIADDICDIGEILGRLPERYFTSDQFRVPLVEMMFGEGSPLVDLFERMGQYHRDQMNVFSKELLPYELTHLSAGEYQYAKIWGAIGEAIDVKINVEGTKKMDGKTNVIVLMDEPETYMHPEFCRNFIDKTVQVLQRRHPELGLQLIMSTHSPFMMSDTLSSQVTRVDYDDDGECMVLEPVDKPYFAANIMSIMADGFFLDYTIGEYARRFLSEKIQTIKRIRKKEIVSQDDMIELKKIRQMIPYIGDELIRVLFENLIEGQI